MMLNESRMVSRVAGSRIGHAVRPRRETATEALELLGRPRGRASATRSTADLRTRAAGPTDSTLVIDFPDETPAGQTRFTTTEPALPRLQLGEDPGHPQAQRRSAVENPPPKGRS
ncbi:hypothetical protein ACFV2U_24370 [Streptomyces sp. NPDC059697]|uniref:hypothetical protein n=1 Tax=Streptomyces sp. NPDC059697 TaxID=3346912 RepID=UPI0036B8FBE3